MSRRLVFIAFCLVLACAALTPAAARADRDYAQRFGIVERGDVSIVANTIMSCPSSVATCAGARDGTGSTVRNSSFTMAQVDVDADASTFNSSSADLALPAGATVLFAGLYWGSDVAAGAGGVAAPDPAAKGNVLLATGSTWAYQAVTATQIDTSRSFGGTRYQGFADVTERVRAAGSGTYTVANVQAATGGDNFGGWGLVVAYRDAGRPVRWLGVYDGFRQFVDDSTYDTTIGGFQTPGGGPVQADFGLMTYEGDLAVSGDVMQVNGHHLTDALHPMGNYFNSYITAYGQHVHAKNPDYLNQLGHEASVVEIDGVLQPGSTSAAIHMATDSDYVQTGPMTLVAEQAATAPAPTVPPAIAGTAREGETLAASPGTWSGTTPMTYAYRWRRCDAAGGSCADIAGATQPSYTVGEADAGRALRVQVTATNVVGSTSASSAATAAVPERPPVNSEAPSISGTAREGETLTASPGTWSGSPSLASVWQRCSPGCVDAGTGPAYELGESDVGATIRVRVTGTNGGGSATAESAPTAAVVPKAPVNSAAPSISGSAREGETLTASPGTWSGSPAFAYEWRRCSPSCVDAGSGPTYVLDAGDVGATIRVRVTATNGGGSATAESTATAVVLEKAPINSAAPAIAGTARDGETLTASPGTWSGDPDLEYEWRRCTPACAAVGSGPAYVLSPDDVGATLRVRVTATNDGGSAVAESVPTAAVAARAPVSVTAPGISGSAREGQTLSASPGTWSGTPTITHAYRWRRCDGTGGGCADIAGATAPTYALTAADRGSTLRVRVTATNAGGTAVADSAATPPVVENGPANTAAPSVAGTARRGETLTGSPGTWSGSPTFAFAWRRCAATCADIPGAVGTTYVLQAADVGSAVQLRVTATNTGGSVTADSAPTAVVVDEAPVSTAAPSISGTAREGETLTAAPGAWTGSPGFTYRWRRCSAACADIPGATGTTHLLGAADVGATIRMRVTAKNSGGETVAESAATAEVAAKQKPVDPPPPVVEPRVVGEPVIEEPPPSTPPPPVEPPPPVVEPACDPLTATYARGRTGVLRLRLRLTGPATAVDFGIPAAMLPKRAKGAVGRLRIAGRTYPLRFNRASKLGLTKGRSASVRLTRGGARVERIGARTRLVDLTLVTARPAPARSDVRIVARVRTASGGLRQAACALP